MDRRDLLKLIALAPMPLPACASSAATAPPAASPGSGRSFHVSPGGNDQADGLSPATAWTSIGHLNARLADGTVRRTDTVLFESGRTFFGKLRPPTGGGDGAGYLTFGAYRGTGGDQRPIISSYKVLNEKGGWRRLGPTTWAVDLSAGAHGLTHTGYDGAQGGGDNIGFLKVDGTIHGNRVWQPGDLAAQWDFYCSTDTLHVHSTAEPTTLAADIRAACDGACVSFADSLRVTSLRFEGSGGHGAQGSASTVRIENNEFAELGGAQLGGTTRYGNGVEVWIDSADVLVSGNVIHDVYDSAMTAQGGPTSSTGTWWNIAFRNNLIYLCNQSVEFWSDGVPGRDRGFVDCRVECNTCLYAGYGWSSTVRPDRDTGVHLLTYGWTLPADIAVRRNLFYDARVAYRYSGTASPGLVCSDNHIAQHAGGLMEFGDPRTIEQGQEWATGREVERSSRFEPLPGEASPDVAGALRRVSPLCGLPRPS